MALVLEDQAPYNPEEHLFCQKDGTAKASVTSKLPYPIPSLGNQAMRQWLLLWGGGISLTSNLCYIHTSSSLAGGRSNGSLIFQSF